MLHLSMQTKHAALAVATDGPHLGLTSLAKFWTCKTDLKSAAIDIAVLQNPPGAPPVPSTCAKWLSQIMKRLNKVLSYQNYDALSSSLIHFGVVKGVVLLGLGVKVATLRGVPELQTSLERERLTCSHPLFEILHPTYSSIQ